MKSEKIPEPTTKRLSLYLRCLRELEAAGEISVSSEALAAKYQLNSAQIRKDLANFGEFGTRGVGYKIETLRNVLTRILGLDRQHRVAIIGSGRLGMALADYYRFLNSNFTVAALFDSDPDKVGKNIGEVYIRDIKVFHADVKRDNIDVAVIAVPAAEAQKAVDLAVGAGIRAVMNFAPVRIRVPSDVKLRSIDMTSALESLSYFLAQIAT